MSQNNKIIAEIILESIFSKKELTLMNYNNVFVNSNEAKSVKTNFIKCYKKYNSHIKDIDYDIKLTIESIVDDHNSIFKEKINENDIIAFKEDGDVYLIFKNNRAFMLQSKTEGNPDFKYSSKDISKELNYLSNLKNCDKKFGKFLNESYALI